MYVPISVLSIIFARFVLLKSICLIATISMVASCSPTAGSTKTTKNFSDQHLAFKDFSQSGNKLNITLECCYNIERLSYKCSLYDTNNKYVKTIEEDVEPNDTKNKPFTIQYKKDVDFKIGTLRFNFVSGKTKDNVSTDDRVASKVYYYDYISQKEDQSKIIGTEKLTYNQKPSSRFSDENYGPYTFSGWEYYVDGSPKTYNYDVPATSDLKLLGKYTYSEEDHLNLIKQNNPYNACVMVKREFYNKFLFVKTESETIQGSGVIFKKSGNKYYVLSNAHVTTTNPNYENLEDTIKVKSDTYTATTVKRFTEYDLSVLRFESSKKALFTHILKQNMNF